MPIYKTLNRDFFKKWTPEMAYVLGFFTADGCMIKNNRGAHFIEFHITDRDILEKIKDLLGSNHKIATRDRNIPNWKVGYRLQIGSKEIFNDLKNLGMTSRKSNIIRMPSVPNEYLNHFVRGYFDGDGHVSASEYQKKDRKNKSIIIITGFTSGSRKFLEDLRILLKQHADMCGGTLYYAQGYRLCFSIHDSLRLYNFMYQQEKDLYLSRKKSIFEHYFNNWGRSSI